ncbi:SDR family NAD(P)-dependent oxidoreductase [Pseudomonas aeruginosa]
MSELNDEQSGFEDTAIAIVGMACRFPGANSVHQYWQNLLNGVESIDVSQDQAGRIHAKAQIEHIECFDHEFFGFSLKEAMLLDPQQRVLLECAWEAMEDAALHGRTAATGVFCGAGPSSYFINNVYGLQAHDSACALYQSSEALARFMATDKEFLASRIAYKLDCRGPAVNVQAACATSLFGVQAAVQALLLGECESAVVGASAISVPQTIPYFFEPGMPFSSDGHCRPFDAQASGTIFGSGAAVIVLKRLSDALAQGDEIHALIRGIATNNDGAHRAGMSAPSVAGQTQVVSEALSLAESSPERIHYIEAHGTATPIGDPIEIKALANVFAERSRQSLCYLGSVKGNIGHLGWAAGMAGLIKGIMIAKYRKIPATLHLQTYNPELHIEDTPFEVNRNTIDLDVDRVQIGVSSFGLGGNNAHLILETAPTHAHAPAVHALPAGLVPLSARSPQALRELIAQYREFLHTQPDEAYATFVANLWQRRTHFDHRACLVATDRSQALQGLQDMQDMPLPIRHSQPVRVALMFSGQGGEHRGMARALYEREPVFRQAVDEFDAICSTTFAARASQLLFDDHFSGALETDISRSQPLIFIVQVAMARLLLSNLHTPAALLGHSLGEYAAACVAGVFTPEQGFMIVTERSRLLHSIGEQGAMLMIATDQEQVFGLMQACGVNASIAATNTQTNTVVSGSVADIETLMRHADACAVTHQRLNISRPGHSALLDPLLEQFEAFVSQFELASPSMPLISGLTGTMADSTVAHAAYWRRQLRETVNWQSAYACAVERGCSHFVEVGVSSALSAMAVGQSPSEVIVLPMTRKGRASDQQYLAVLARLYSDGAQLSSSLATSPHLLEGLPSYPFQRVRCWIESNVPEASTPSLYKTTWHPLSCENAQSISTPPTNVLLLTPDSHSRYCSALQRAFGQVWAVDSAPWMRAAQGPDHCVPAAIDTLWREYPEGFDCVYADLTHLPTDEPDAAVMVCAYLLSIVRSLTRTYAQLPRLCAICASPGAMAHPDHPSALATSVAALFRTVMIECPQLRACVVHFVQHSPAQLDDENESRVLRQVLHSDEALVHCSDGTAQVPRLEAANFEQTPMKFDNGITYLLLGGGGGIGRHLIQRLVDDHVSDIHVIGRSMRPTDELQAIMRSHPQVHYHCMDTSSEQGREECRAWASSARLGKLCLFNLAVDLQDKLYEDVSIEDLRRAFAAKCTAILTLCTVLAEQGLQIQWVINFSSATALLGNGGQAAYGAASAFLDALPTQRFAAAAKVSTINWGVWLDAGALRDQPQRQHILQAGGLLGHSSAQGIDYLSQLMAQPPGNNAFMKLDVEQLAARSPACARLLEQLTPSTQASAISTPDSLTLAERLSTCHDERARRLELEPWLMKTVDNLVGLNASTQRSFQDISQATLAELGFDSLAKVQLRNALTTQLGIDYSIKQLQQIANMDALAQVVATLTGTEQWRAPGARPQSQDGVETGESPVSIQQARWLSLIAKGYGLRVIPYRIHAPLQREHCYAALSQVLDEEPLLRTFFPQGRPQIRSTHEVLDSFDALFVDLRDVADPAQQLGEQVRAMARTLPQPQVNVTWALRFIDVGAPFFIALLGVQHLEFDGKSLTLMLERFAHCLHAFTRNQTPRTRAEGLRYADYARRQAQYHSTWAEDAAFFRGLFNAFEGPTALPDHPGFTLTTVAPSSRYSIELPSANRRLSALGGEYGFSVFNAVLYAYASTMAHVLRCDKLMISMINSGRGLEEFNDVIGPFTSPWPIPITVHHQWLDGIGMVARTINAMQDYPLMHPSMLIDVVPAFAGMALDTYFSDLGINFLNYRHTVPAPDQVRVEGVEILGPISDSLLAQANIEDMQRVPGLHLVVEILEDDLRLNFWHHSQRFSHKQVEGWAQLMSQKLDALLQLTESDV